MHKLNLKNVWESISNFFKFYGKLLEQDRKGLFKYLYLKTLQTSLISFGIYSLVLFSFVILSYDFNVEGSLLGISIGIIKEKIFYFFICISIYYIFITFSNMFMVYIKLYSNFNKWNYGEKSDGNILSQGSKEVKLFNKTLIKVVSLNWMDRKTFEGEDTEYLHLLKYDHQKLREDVIDELL